MKNENKPMIVEPQHKPVLLDEPQLKPGQQVLED